MPTKLRISKFIWQRRPTVRTKCMPLLLYGLEACIGLLGYEKSDINSLNFIVNQLFMKIIRTTTIDVVDFLAKFNFELTDSVTEQRSSKFLNNYRSYDSLCCQMLCIWCFVYFIVIVYKLWTTLK